MAKLSDLVLRTSEVTGVSLPTVREISRRLREGGLIHTGKGGRYGGAKMAPNDAARLLTALLIAGASTFSLADIVSLTKKYLALRAHGARGQRLALTRWGRQLGLPELCELKTGHTFDEAFTALMVSFLNGQYERRRAKWNWGSVLLTIETDPEPQAQITIAGDGYWSLFYVRRAAADHINPAAAKKWSDIPENQTFDLTVRSQITEMTLKCIGLLLRKPELADG